MSYKCEIVADSRNTFGNRITTFLITFPRFILAEFNTHRMFSRNSASSRAIPFKKMVQSVKDNPFIPIKWMKDHSGMQGTEYFTDEEVAELNLVEEHLEARDQAIKKAISQNEKGVTKQVCNRYLEFYAWHTCLVTSTEWDNFFSLRAQKDAEIHIQKIAFMMLEAYNNSAPTRLAAGDWHIPFRDKLPGFDYSDHYNSSTKSYGFTLSDALKISSTMCARTSYTVVGEEEKKQDFAKDIALHDRLSASGHWSPFEHCARSMSSEEFMKFQKTQPLGFESNSDYEHLGDWVGIPGRAIEECEGMDMGIEYGWCGNFRGFIQYRKFFPSENRSDDRVMKHHNY